MLAAVTGGHVAAQAPVQVDALLLSASNRYMARPWLPARNLPSMPETDARPIVMAALELAALAGAGLLAWAVAEDVAGAAVLAEPEPLEQAVAARAIPAAQAAAAIQFFMRMLPRDNASASSASRQAPGCLLVPTGEYVCGAALVQRLGTRCGL